MGEKFENVEQQFRSSRFEKLLKRNKGKEKFNSAEMSPYEIINYLRDRDVRKNYKVFPSNRFLKRIVCTSLFAVFLIIFCTIIEDRSLVQRNLDIFVSKVDGRSEFSDIIENRIEYVMQGDFNTVIDAYLANQNSSISQSFELVTLLSSINNFSKAKDELSKIKSRLEHGSFNRGSDEYKLNLYRLIDELILINDLDTVGDILETNRSILGSEILFLEREIVYLLLTDNNEQALNIYSSISIDGIEDTESLLSYANLSIIFNNIGRSVSALDKALSKEIDNINVLSIIDMMASYDFEELRRILDSLIESQPDNERLNLIRARVLRGYLLEDGKSVEDIDKVIKKNLDKNLPKIIKLDILSYTSRDDDITRLVNELKSIENKTFDIYYALASHSLDTGNFNDALNYIKQSLHLNESFGYSYNVLLNILSSQGKSTNVNYFYLKTKSLDLLNTNIDKEFSEVYLDAFSDISKAIDILEFANKISVFESDLKYEIANIYIDQRKYSDAKQKLYEAIDLNERAIYFRTLGVLLIELGEAEDGISNIRKAYSMDPEDILNLNNAAAYYVNVEKDIQRAFSNAKAAYEGLDGTYSEYEIFIIRGNYLKLSSIYDESTGEFDSSSIPFMDYLY